MKFTAALIAAAFCLASIADAKVHKVGLKKIPKEDRTLVLYTLCGSVLTDAGTHGWIDPTFETKVHGLRPRRIKAVRPRRPSRHRQHRKSRPWPPLDKLPQRSMFPLPNLARN